MFCRKKLSGFQKKKIEQNRLEDETNSENDFSYKILILENDPQLGQNCQDHFEKQGFSVEISSEGMEGISKVAEFRPHVVILDVLEPMFGGQELFDAIRENAAADMAIVIYTNLPKNDGHAKNYIAGADACFLKDKTYPHMLVKEVKKILKKKAECDEE